MNPRAEKKTPAKARQRAIVIGGSLAGMLAARVLLDHYDEVTVLESDHYPGHAGSRSGIPQSKHAHVLMLRGQEILEQLFPGIQASLVAADAQLIDMAGEAQWLTPAGWGVRFPSPLIMLACTRDLLDWHVRLRVASHPRIRFAEEREVTGLLRSSNGSHVTGIRIRARGNDAATVGSELHGDLVVDASGRRSKLPQWLGAMGYGHPKEDLVNGFMGYASRIYEGGPATDQTSRITFIQAAPPDVTRGGLVQPIEQGRFMVTLLGLGRDYPPVDETGFLDFARSLRSPLIYEFLRNATPLTPIAGARQTENRWRHFEKLGRWPNGLVTLGDAVCAFNPVYGQGMTTAALGALTLDRCLRDRRRGFEKKFQAALAQVVKAPWMLATSEDFRVHGTEGGAPDLKTRLMHRYMDHVIQLTTFDRAVRFALLKVMHMLESPATLFHPSVLLQVARHAAGWPQSSANCAANKRFEMGNGVP